MKLVDGVVGVCTAGGIVETVAVVGYVGVVVVVLAADGCTVDYSTDVAAPVVS